MVHGRLATLRADTDFVVDGCWDPTTKAYSRQIAVDGKKLTAMVLPGLEVRDSVRRIRDTLKNPCAVAYCKNDWMLYCRRYELSKPRIQVVRVSALATPWRTSIWFLEDPDPEQPMIMCRHDVERVVERAPWLN